LLARHELARRRLGDFLGELLPRYERPAHATRLVEHLEALEAREIQRLMVTMPPRHGKTLHVSQALPAWYLGRHPSEHVILASYAAELAEHNSRRARGFVLDPRWPFPDVSVSAASAAVGRWNTTGGGGCIAAGVGGGITGFGANLLVVDDPVKGREEADSVAIRESIWRWWTEVALTRLQPGAVVLLTQTRWHEDDLAGRVLNGPGAADWTVLSLPALAEESDAIGRAEGEALWPDWFSADHLESLRMELGERAFAALYMQRPTSERGGIFRREWLAGRYARLADGLRVVQAVDSAFKTGVANDWSAIATWATDGAWYYLVDVWRRKVEFPDLVRAIQSQAEAHSPEAVLIEDTAAGQSAIQELRRHTGLPVVAVKAGSSKVARAEAVSPLFEAGKVLLPEQSPAWLSAWVEEHVSFPTGRHDDMVDTTSIALGRLRSFSRAGGGVAGVVIEDGRRPAKSIEDEVREYENRKALRRAIREAERQREIAVYRDPRESSP
jgi:predicted phage terminase large subunit-like protein